MKTKTYTLIGFKAEYVNRLYGPIINRTIHSDGPPPWEAENTGRKDDEGNPIVSLPSGSTISLKFLNYHQC